MDRKMAKVVTQVKMDDEDTLDVDFWLSKNFAERLQEVARLRKNYYTWLNGYFPVKIDRVINVVRTDTKK
jgi:hypothetical protein